MSVKAAVEKELVLIAKRDKDVAASPLAALALALADEVDAAGNSATAKSACGKVLLDALARLAALLPVEQPEGKLDELQNRRKKKLRATGT